MGTLTAFLAPGIAPANATRIPIFPPTLDTGGLVGWWTPEDASVDGSGRVTSMVPRVGALKFLPSAAGNAPLVEDAPNGRNLLHTTIARADKLVLEPVPAGSPWPNVDATGFSFLMPIKLLNVTSTPKGLANLFGFQVRHYSARLQVQRPYSGGTEEYNAPFDASALSVMGITVDVSNVVGGTTTPILKLFKDGAMIGSKAISTWTGLATSVGVLGALTNLGGTPSEAQFGDALMYNTVKSESQMATISAALRALYGL